MNAKSIQREKVFYRQKCVHPQEHNQDGGCCPQATPRGFQTKAAWQHSRARTRARGRGVLPQTVLPDSFPLEGGGKMTPFCWHDWVFLPKPCSQAWCGRCGRRAWPGPLQRSSRLSPPSAGCEGRPPSLAGIYGLASTHAQQVGRLLCHCNLIINIRQSHILHELRPVSICSLEKLICRPNLSQLRGLDFYACAEDSPKK